MGSLCRPGRAGTRSQNQRRQRGRDAVRFLPHLLRGCAWEQRRRREAGPWARVPFGPSFPTSVPTPRPAASAPARQRGPRGSLPGPRAPRRHPRASPWHRAASRPARPAARPPSGSSLPAPRPRSCGGGVRGGGSRRRREEIGGATPAPHWLPRRGARSPASLAGSRDPFQRWPPCCFDE